MSPERWSSVSGPAVTADGHISEGCNTVPQLPFVPVVERMLRCAESGLGEFLYDLL